MLRTRILVVMSVAMAIGVGVLPRLRAQTPSTPADSPSFEVVSVKPNRAGPQSLQRVSLQPGDRVTFINYSRIDSSSWSTLTRRVSQSTR